MNTEYGLVLTTFPNVAAAQKILDGLLENHLAACVQTLPVQSTYRWKGAVQSEGETLMLIKTRIALYPEVEAYIRTHHAYEVPEIILLPIADGLDGYLQWIKEETK